MICNFSKHKVKTPCGWCTSTETCRSTYKNILIYMFVHLLVWKINSTKCMICISKQ